MSDEFALFLIGCLVGFLLAGFVAVFSIDGRAERVCADAAAEIDRDCYLDDGVCWCADGASIRKLGGGE